MHPEEHPLVGLGVASGSSSVGRRSSVPLHRVSKSRSASLSVSVHAIRTSSEKAACFSRSTTRSASLSTVQSVVVRVCSRSPSATSS
nr:hypothetical protein [Halogeometricum sp. CBA1124]